MRCWALLLLCAAPVLGHEFWIEASTYRPAPGEAVACRLFVGDGFPGEAYARNPAHIESFFLLADGRRRAVPGRDGADPAGRLHAPATAGTAVIVYRSRRSRVELPAGEFERYLVEEGLEAIVRQRKERGESGEPGREVFSRCAKTLLRSRGGRGGGHDALAGLPLELVPEEDPAAIEPGAPLTLRVLEAGAPLPGALVRAFPKEGGGEPLAVRTGADGRASFRLPRAGVWMVSTLAMRRAPEGLDADWESLWSSLTFEFGRVP
ncbi:MAG: DUF4198 domain-containing protein [Planctomycetaceae bacterium]